MILEEVKILYDEDEDIIDYQKLFDIKLKFLLFECDFELKELWKL
jgi:hypothetical protein